MIRALPNPGVWGICKHRPGSTNQPFPARTSGSSLADTLGAALTLAASTLHVPVVVLT
jgi:hypothetical protein